MEALTQTIRFELWLILCGLALVVVYKLLTGRINMTGLLDDTETGTISPGRVQLILFILIGAGSYLSVTAATAADRYSPAIS